MLAIIRQQKIWTSKIFIWGMKPSTWIHKNILYCSSEKLQLVTKIENNGFQTCSKVSCLVLPFLPLLERTTFVCAWYEALSSANRATSFYRSCEGLSTPEPFLYGRCNFYWCCCGCLIIYLPVIRDVNFPYQIISPRSGTTYYFFFVLFLAVDNVWKTHAFTEWIRNELAGGEDHGFPLGWK